MILCVLLLYVALIMPFRLAFYETVFFDAWAIAELVVDSLFIFDMIVNMFSSYINSDNHLEWRLRKIMWKYIKGWFFIDLVACIPFTLIENYAIESD